VRRRSRRVSLPVTDDRTVEGFGYEWTKFDQSARSEADLRETFLKYFAGFPWDDIAEGAKALDAGCGTGRWARFAAERVTSLHCVDPSLPAVRVASRATRDRRNCHTLQAAAGQLPFAEATFDLGYCLGVLHHTPSPAAALSDVVRTLKVGAPLLVYVYYALDNRPLWFRAAWRASDLLRRALSLAPVRWRYFPTQLIAVLVYLPMARFAAALERRGINVEALPLSAYRNKSLYVMRTDAFDRLGTPVEKRFTARQLEELMVDAGLSKVTVAQAAPHWRALGYRTA
jgi:SAM-dependent methyltransferase